MRIFDEREAKKNTNAYLNKSLTKLMRMEVG